MRHYLDSLNLSGWGKSGKSLSWQPGYLGLININWKCLQLIFVGVKSIQFWKYDSKNNVEFHFQSDWNYCQNLTPISLMKNLNCKGVIDELVFFGVLTQQTPPDLWLVELRRGMVLIVGWGKQTTCFKLINNSSQWAQVVRVRLVHHDADAAFVRVDNPRVISGEHSPSHLNKSPFITRSLNPESSHSQVQVYVTSEGRIVNICCHGCQRKVRF